MTLRDLMKNQLEKNQLSQKAVAMDWYTRVGERGAPETPVSRLSQLMNGNERGIRYFLDDSKRFDALLDAFVVDAAQREQWRAAAEELRANGSDEAPRLIFDLSGVAVDRKSWMAVERVLQDPRLRPVLLIVDDVAFREMPRTVDEMEGVQQVRVRSVDEARERVAELAPLGGLVLSVFESEPDERWAVPFIEESEVRTEPPEAITWFLEGKPLPTAPAPEIELGVLLAGAPGNLRNSFDRLQTRSDGSFVHWSSRPHRLELSNREVRRLRYHLADANETFELTWRQRVELGEELGVPVAASRVEQALVARTIALHSLGEELRLEKGDKEDLDAVLRRAERRPTESAMLQVGEVLHIVNPGTPVQKGTFVRVHEVQCTEPVILKVLREVGDWTTDDWDLDPDLTELTLRLAETGADLKLLLHARATVLKRGRDEVGEGAALEDPIGALSRIVSVDPPAARLQPLPPPTMREAYAWFPPFTKLGHRLGQCPTALAAVPGVKYPTIARNTPYLVLPHGTLSYSGQNGIDEHLVVIRKGRRRDPVELSESADPEDWLDAVERSPWISSEPGDEVRTEHEPYWQGTDQDRSIVSGDEEMWRAADQQIALLWLLLRVALVAPRVVRLHDGHSMLYLGGGMAALVRGVRRVTECAGATAIVPVDLEPKGSSVCVKGIALRQHTVSRARVETLTPRPRVVETGPSLPIWFRLSLGTEVVELTPIASTWGTALDMHAYGSGSLDSDTSTLACGEASTQEDLD